MANTKCRLLWRTLVQFCPNRWVATSEMKFKISRTWRLLTMIVASVKTWLQATKICKTLYLELKVVVNPLILSQNTRISYARLCQHKAVSAINRGDSIRKVTYSLSTKHYLNSNHVVSKLISLICCVAIERPEFAERATTGFQGSRKEVEAIKMT